jgi:hypothetical protein
MPILCLTSNMDHKSLKKKMLDQGHFHEVRTILFLLIALLVTIVCLCCQMKCMAIWGIPHMARTYVGPGSRLSKEYSGGSAAATILHIKSVNSGSGNSAGSSSSGSAIRGEGLILLFPYLLNS